MNRQAFALSIVLTFTLIAASFVSAEEHARSPSRIEIPQIETVPLELDVPEEIKVAQKINAGTVGMPPESWGERRYLYYGGFEFRTEENGLTYVDPLAKDKTVGVEHYELVYNGDLLTEILFRDVRGNLKVDENHEAAVVRHRYDKNGNLIEESSHNPDGSLRKDWYGFAVYRWEYDDNHRRISAAFYDPDGKLTNKKFSEVAVNRWAFDENGNQVLWINYDANGKPTRDVLGAAARHYQYNKDGQKTLEAMYGADRKLIDGNYGFAVTLREYDSMGNISGISYYSADLKPAAMRGVSAERFIHGPDNKQIEISYYDGEGNLTKNNEGVAIIIDTYDENSVRTHQKAYDEKKRLISELSLDRETGKWQPVPQDGPIEKNGK